MKQGFASVRRGENGEVMIEASIILFCIITLLMALLSISFMFYQQALMNTIATEVASEVAKNYKFTQIDVGKSDYSITNTYGANIGGAAYGKDEKHTKIFGMTFSKQSIEDSHESKAETYAKERLEIASLGLNPGTIGVKCEMIGSGIGRVYVKVTVSQETEYFMSGVLEFLGIADKSTLFETTAYAECVDLIGYSSMVNFTQSVSDVLHQFGPVGDLVQSVKGLYNSVKDFVDGIME